MTITDINQHIINVKLNNMKYGVRRTYRNSTELEKLSCAWIDNLSSYIIAQLTEVLELADNNHSMLSVAVASMNGTTVKANK